MNESSWGAIRLPINVDANKLVDEVNQFGPEAWNLGGRTAPVFADSAAIFLRGYAAAERNSAIEDREALKSLPYMRTLIHELIPAQPMKAVLSMLPPMVDVGFHIDRGRYFDETLRVHFPVVSHDQVTMYFSGCYAMKPGEVWLVDNCSLHGVYNRNPNCHRTHLIVDFLPSEELVQLTNRSENVTAERSAEIETALRQKTSQTG